MLVECPFCYARVHLRGDRTCPSCQERVDPEKKSPFVSVSVREGALVPPICCRCGTGTELTVTVELAQRPQGNRWLRWLAMLSALLYKPRFLLLHSDAFGPAGVTKNVIVRMPVCSACRHDGRLEPRHVDFENEDMEFVVHRKFRTAFRKLQAR